MSSDIQAYFAEQRMNDSEYMGTLEKKLERAEAEIAKLRAALFCEECDGKIRKELGKS